MTEGLTISERPMGRGGRQKDRDGPERRCLATGTSGPTDLLIRFVLSPDGKAVPDLAGKLPGRGAWLTANRELVGLALKKRLFSRAFRQPVDVPDDLADRLEDLLAQRLVDLISLARKAGQVVTGAEKVRARIREGGVAVLLQASDGARDGRAKVRALARAAGDGTIEEVEVLTASELGLAFGREFAIHAALDAGGFAARVSAEARRLAGMRGGSQPGGQADEAGTDILTERAPEVSGNTDNTASTGDAREQDDL